MMDIVLMILKLAKKNLFQNHDPTPIDTLSYHCIHVIGAFPFSLTFVVRK